MEVSHFLMSIGVFWAQPNGFLETFHGFFVLVYLVENLAQFIESICLI